LIEIAEQEMEERAKELDVANGGINNQAYYEVFFLSLL